MQPRHSVAHTNRAIRLRRWLLLLLAAGLPLFLLTVGLREVRSQGDEFSQLWHNVQRAGSYAFKADITQHTVPVASVYNVGRSSERQDLRMEGETNLRNETFQMTLWSEGGNVLDLGTGIEVQLADGKTMARRTGEAWQEIGSFNQMMMPRGDFLAFLAGATAVENQGEETRNGLHFTRYTYQIDGKRFAEAVRRKLEAELRNDSLLAPDRTLALPPLMAEMTGVGELWVTRDAAGRQWPLRQIVHLEFPAEDGFWSTSELKVDFYDFGAGPAPFLTSMPAVSQWLEGLLQRFPFLLAGTMTGVVLCFIILRRRSRLVYTSLATACILSLVIGPLLQSVYAAQADRRLSARQAQEETLQQEMEMIQSLQAQQNHDQNTSNANPGTLTQIRNDAGMDSDGDGVSDLQEAFIGSNPVAADEDEFWRALVDNLQVDPNLDSDGDGLADREEILLGTLPDEADSDGDMITDTLEIQGFTLAGKQWYSNPLEQDSNNDENKNG